MTHLDRAAFNKAMEAFWDAPTGNDKGVEAAIITYLTEFGIERFHNVLSERRAEVALIVADNVRSAEYAA